VVERILTQPNSYVTRLLPASELIEIGES